MIAVVGEDDEDGKDGVLPHFGMEERGLLRRVIGVGAKGELLLRVGVAGRHGGGRNQLGHDEVVGKSGEEQGGEDDGDAGQFASWREL